MKRYRPMHPLKRINKVIRELEQLIRDQTWWNNHRTEHHPFDIGRDLVLLNKAREVRDAWNPNDTTAFSERNEELVELFLGRTP